MNKKQKPKIREKKIKPVKAWGFLNKKDNTLYNFAMSVSDFTYFKKITKNTSVEMTKGLRVIEVLITPLKSVKGKKK